MKRLGLLLLVLLVLASPASVLAKKRKAWTEKELEALERQWEDGDAEEDLDTPERKHRMEMEAAEKAKKEGKEAPVPMKSGPAMMFVELVPDAAPDGKAWRDKDVDALSKRWSQMLLSGGVNAQIYNIGEKVLATFDRQLTQDTNDFLLEQPEVDFLTLDSRNIYPKYRMPKV